MSKINRFADSAVTAAGETIIAAECGGEGAESVRLSMPDADDGAALQRLIAACPPLDANSLYCNLLHCTHFRGTSVAAKIGPDLVGFVSGYALPERPDTLFVWQVAVAPAARGRALGRRMVRHLVDRAAAFRHMETSITPGNSASWRMFETIAQDLRAQMSRSPWFDRVLHLDDRCDDEVLVRIGPFQNAGGGDR